MAWMFSTAAFKSRGELIEAEEDEVDGACDCGGGGGGGGGADIGPDGTASSEAERALELFAPDEAIVSRRGGEPAGTELSGGKFEWQGSQPE